MCTFLSYRKGVMLVLFTLICTIAFSQNLVEKINPDLFEKRWPANWIFHPEASGTGYGVYHFRKSFSLETQPESFVIHVSADNRY
ncbi:hypothetical protein ACFLU5_13055 [Bacteroidota bacterium]